MIALRLEAVLVCGGCQVPVPLGSVAASVDCPRCRHALATPPEAWNVVLRALRVDALEMAPGEERTSERRIAAGTVRTTHARAVPEAALEVRAVQGFDGVSAFVGEAKPELGVQAVSPPLDLPCPSCGGQLRVDGATRLVPCAYCRRDVLLPDDAWARLNPARPLRAFFVVFDDDERALRVAFRFHDARIAVRDAEGNLYVRGQLPARAGATSTSMSGDTRVEDAVWSYDAELRLRWVSFPAGEFAGMAAMPGGATLVLYDDTSSSADDRTPRATLDATTGERVDDDDTFAIPLESNGVLDPDTDGTFLVIRHGVIRRFAKDGTPARVFPRRHDGFWGRLFLDDNTMLVSGHHAGIMPNGDLAVVSFVTTPTADGSDVVEEPHAARYDRGGKKLYSQSTRFTDHDVRSPLQGDDADGVYVLAGGMVWRNSPGECRPVPLTGKVGAFVALANGDVWAFMESGAIRYASRQVDGIILCSTSLRSTP